MMTGTLVLYALSLILGKVMFPHNTPLSLVFFASILLLHICEVPHARSITGPRSISVIVTIVMTLLFGFTWWWPLKRGII